MNTNHQAQLRDATAILATVRQINKLFVSEKNTEKLIRSTCEILVNTRGYNSAWILLLDSKNKCTRYACYGPDWFKDKVQQAFKIDNLPGCISEIIKGKKFVATNSEVDRCPLGLVPPGFSAFTMPIVDNNDVYGLICATLHDEFSTKPEEQNLFKDLVNDIAFALGKIKLGDRVVRLDDKYKNLVESLDDYIFIMQDDVIKFVNPLLCKFSGYTEEEVLGHDFSVFVPKEQLSLIRDHYKNRQQTEYTSDKIESIFQTKTGKQIDVEVKAIPIEFENRPAIMFVLKDISKYKETLTRLKESEERATFLSKSTFEGIVVHKKGVIVDVNDSFFKITGYSREEAIGKNLLDYIPFTVDKAKAIANMALFRAKSYLVTGAKKDGSKFVAEIEGKDVKFNDETVRIVAIRDVTEREEMQQLIDEGERKYKTLVGNLPGVIYTCHNNRNWDMTLLSEGCVSLLGYKPEELVGNDKLCYNDIIYPDDREMVWDSIQKAIEKTSQFEIEYRVVTKDGKQKWVWEKGRFVDHKKEKMLEGFITDLSEKKQSEIELNKTHNELQRAHKIGKLGTWAVNFNTGKLTCSEQASEICGFTDGERLNIDSFSNICLPEYQELFLKSLRKLVKSEAEFDYEYKIQNPGTGKLVDIHIIAEYDVSSNEVSGIIQDITSQKAYQVVIKKSEAKYKALFNSLNDAAFVHSFKSEGVHNFIEVNDIACQRYGYTKSEFLNLSAANITVNHEKQTNAKGRKEFLEKKRMVFETIHIKKDGSQFPVEISSRIFEVDGKSLIFALARDITERKKAEQELMESERKFRSIFENNGNTSLIMDETGKILMANAEMKEVLGYDKDDIARGITWMEMAHPDDLERMLEQHRLRNNRSKEALNLYEIRLLHKNGQTVHVMLNIALIADSMLRVASLLDITSRKNAEMELKESEEKLRGYLQNAPYGIFVANEEGLIIDANIACEELTAYRRSELIGKSKFTDFVLEEDLARVKLAFQKLVKTGNPMSGAINFVTNKQQKRVFQINAVKINPTHYLGFITNITQQVNDDARMRQLIKELQNFEEELLQKNELLTKEKNNTRASEEKFRFIADNSIDCIWQMDRRLKFMYISPSLKELLGFEPEEWINTSLHEHMRRKDFIKTARLSLRMLKQYKTFGHITFTTWLINKENNLVPVEINGKPMLDKEGKLFGLQGTTRDINEKIKAEKEILRINQELELKNERLVENFEELKNAKDRAEESDRLKSAFLANMSHEIRTPMNGILGFTELLKEPTLSGEEQEQFVDIIQKSGNRMLSTINDLIDISKIESGLAVVDKKEVDVRKVCNELYQFFLLEAQKKGLKLILEEDKATKFHVINTDLDKLNSILTNLLKNAIKFTHKGEVRFGYTFYEKSIGFFVSDTGVGIPKEKQEAVFDRFVQAEMAKSKVYEGSGLGLAITKSYTEMLNGKLTLVSEPGVGTTFQISFPTGEVTDKKDATDNIVADVANKEPQLLKVLVAEDDYTSVLFLELVLNPIASEILVASNGREAVEIVRSNPDIDLVLMDIKMPVMDGLEATNKIREFNSDVIIIAQTAFAFANDNTQALNAGCNDYITKPVDRNILLSSIKHQFSGSRN